MRYQGAYQLGPLSQILCGQKGVNGIADGDAKPFWVAADLITEENPRRQLCDDLEDARFQDHLVPFCKTLLTFNETLLVNLPVLSVHSFSNAMDASAERGSVIPPNPEH